MKFSYRIILLSALCLLPACSNQEGDPGAVPAGRQNPIIISATTGGFSREVIGELLPTRSAPTMVDFPETADLPYKEPVALFGFFLQDDRTADADSKGCFGETKDSIVNNLLRPISDLHKANVLQETFGSTAPSREYLPFMTNAAYVYSDSVNPPYGAYVSNDIAAFWRPDSYHYFISYAPPMPDANLVEPLVLLLRTSAHGVQGEPDFNFLYGRRVLQYNDAHSGDGHPYHKTNGVTIKLSPMLSQLAFHLKCDDMLVGSAVLFAFRVTTYKEARFHLDNGTWEFGASAGHETITRYYDDDYIIPTAWDAPGNSFSLSLFPNLVGPTDPVVVGQADPADNTPVVVQKLEVCINNTWYEVFDLEEHSGDIDGEHSKVGEVIPLVPGYKTDVYLSVAPKGGIEEWNKLLVTFSNWNRDDIYEFDGTLE